MPSVAVQPLEEAIAKMNAKTPVGSMLKSADWADVPLALRERAFFSSSVESVRLLSEMERKLQARLAHVQEAVARGEAFVDRSSFIGDMRKLALDLGVVVDPAHKGGLQDITSRKRLGLIFDIQDAQAKEFARWKAEQDADILDAFPAMEFLRLEHREKPRAWRDKWAAAGGRFYDGRMIARKDDPIWRAINRFGVPWGPWDFGSGMGTEDVGRDEAEELGVIAPGQAVPPQEADFNAALEADLRGISPRFRDALKNLFGDQVREAGGKLQWRGNVIGDLFDRALADRSHSERVVLGQPSPDAVRKAKAIGEDIAGVTFDLSADAVRHAVKQHGDQATEAARGQRAITKLDFELLPTALRQPDAVRKGNGPDRVTFEATFAGRYVAGTWIRSRRKKAAELKTLYVKEAKP